MINKNIRKSLAIFAGALTLSFNAVSCASITTTYTNSSYLQVGNKVIKDKEVVEVKTPEGGFKYERDGVKKEESITVTKPDSEKKAPAQQP